MRLLTISFFVLVISGLGLLAPGTGTAEAATDDDVAVESSSGISAWSLTRLFSIIRGDAAGEDLETAQADAGTDVVEVEIVPRDAWGAQGGKGHWMDQRRVDEVVVHHFWRPSLPDVVSPAEETELMQRVERVHVEDNGWRGIGYHFVVFQSGRVYEGRGWGREGGHTTGRNEDSIGIVFAIDGDVHEPTEEAWEAAEALVELGVAEGHLTDDVTISGHTDHAEKSCPGELIQPHIQRLAP